MAREKLPDRRPAVTKKIKVLLDGGKETHSLVTIGFAEVGSMSKPCEVFCADFKAGTSMQALVMDACILVSRLLQHGDLPEDMIKSLCEPPSVVGSIVRCVVDHSRSPETWDE